jgi:hypothetical protein
MSLRFLRRMVIVVLVTAALLSGTGTVSALQMRSHQDAAPGMAQIKARLSHTREIGSRGAYFVPAGTPLTIKDGRGTGSLTVVIGKRYPTAHGLGEIVFFWHNATFIGMSSTYETPAVVKLQSPARGTFVITYARYKHTDRVCCPRLKPRTVRYGWSGHILISNGVPPKGAGSPPRVKYQP